MRKRRRRFTRTSTLEDRLVEDIAQLRKRAAKMSPGPAQDQVLQKIRENETAAHIIEWLSPPERSVSRNRH
jgi:hypothetical protein